MYIMYLLNEGLSGGERDLRLHAIGHVLQQDLRISTLIANPQVIKEVEDTPLYSRRQLLLFHVPLQL